MSKTLYVVMNISTHQMVSVRNCEPPLKDKIKMCWADGMIGVLPIFSTREDAINYASDEGIEIMEIEPA